MGGEWELTALGQCIEVKHGFAFKGEFISDEPGGDILLTPGNFAIGGGFKADKLKYYHGSTPADYVLQDGDLLVTMTDLSKQGDTLGFPALIPVAQDGRRFLHNQRLGKVLITAPDIIDKGFLNYLLRSDGYRHEVLSSATGSTVRHTSPERIRRFEFRRPSLPEQRAIAYILGTLDDKIELNRRMSSTLEAIAIALFTSWLEAIEPARMQAQDLIREDLLEIGDGYRAKNSELGSPGLPFIRAGQLRNGFDVSSADILHQDSVARAQNKISRVGDVAFTSKGTIGRFARVSETTPIFVYSPQICYWRSLAHDKIDPAVLYCWMQSEDLKKQIDAVAGQTDMAPYVSLRDQRRMEIPVFPENQRKLSATLRPLLSRQSIAGGEVETLATVRDALLPKLISGELRVKEAETFLERVL